MSVPGDDAMFRRLSTSKPGAQYPPEDWDEIERSTDTWPEFLQLVREIKARGMSRSLFGKLTISGLSLSVGGLGGMYDSSLLISRSAEGPNYLKFQYVNSHRDPRQDWEATYPPEQVIPAFYRFVTRAGWFPKGHPMLAGMETGVPYDQA